MSWTMSECALAFDFGFGESSAWAEVVFTNFLDSGSSSGLVDTVISWVEGIEDVLASIVCALFVGAVVACVCSG